MSFWDRLGEIWDKTLGGGAKSVGNLYDQAGQTPTLSSGDVGPVVPLGVAWEAAKQDPNFDKGGFINGLKVGAQTSGLGPAMDIQAGAFSQLVGRPVSTYNNVANSAGLPSLGQTLNPTLGGFTYRPDRFSLTEIFDADQWSRAWEDSKTISAGQSEMIGQGAVPQDVTFARTPEAQAARDTYFRETWAGKLSSGSIDLGLNLVADPTYAALKGLKTIEKAGTILRAGDKTAVVTGLREGLDAGGPKRIEKTVLRVDSFLRETDNLPSASEIALHPMMSQNPAKGSIATMFDAANKSFPGNTPAAAAARRDAKLDIWLATMGDSQAVARLATRQDELANALERLSTPPAQTRYLDDFTWDDFGYPVTKANPPAVRVPKEVEAQRSAILSEMRRLDEIAATAGVQNKVGITALEAATYANRQVGLRSSVLRGTGLGSRPIVLLGGALGNRLEGHITLRDPGAGLNQLDTALRQAPYMTGVERREIMDRWVRAVSDGDRQGVVRAAEAAIVRSTARHYNVPMETAEALIEAGNQTRRGYLGVMKTRLYSAIDANDELVAMVDPERDISVVRSRPIAQSQIEDFHPIVDPRQLDALFKRGLHRRLFEEIGAVVGKGAGVVANQPGSALAASALGRKAGTRLYSVADPLVGLTQDALSRFMRVWKDATLLPRGIAYAARIQTDSQMRLGTHMGVLNYFGMLPKTLRVAMMVAKEGKLDLSKGDSEALVKWLMELDFNEDEAGNILRGLVSSGGQMADLMSNASQALHQKYMLTDSWGIVKQNDPLWHENYIRAVRQIRNSPTMQQIIKGMPDDELAAWVMKDPAGRREWTELRGTWEDNLDGYLQEARAHVNHYLPDATTKKFALVSDAKPFEKRDVTEEGIRRWFDGAGMGRRMEIHGEAYSPVTVSKYSQNVEKFREGLYNLVADAPETVLARVPIFVHEFKREYAAIMNNLTADGAIVSLERADMARKTAARIAKRNVTKILFDSSDTSNLAHHFRLVSPFFAAWEDMMKKWGRLFYNNPQTAVRFQQAWEAPTDAGIAEDEYGNEIRSDGSRWLRIKQPDGTYKFRKLDPATEGPLIGERQMVVVPLSFIPKSLRNKVGSPAEFKIDQRSFNILFQGDPPWLPGTGPLVALPTNEYVRRVWPEGETNPIIEYLLPFGTTNDSAVDTVLPAWAKNLKKSGVGPFGTNDDLRKQMGILYKEEYIKYQKGERKTEPTVDEVANKARNWYLMRFYLSLTSPVAVTPSQELQFYIDQGKQYQQLYGNPQASPEYQKLLPEYIEKYGLKNADKYLVFEHPEFMGAEQRFYKDYPEYFDLYQSLSTNETGLKANLATVSKIKEFPKEMSKYSEWSWAIAGPDNAYGLDPAHAFSNSAYNYQQVTSIQPGGKEKYRSVLDADKALDAAEASKGWVQYQQARTQIDLALEQAGLTSLRSERAAPLKAVLDAYVDQIGRNNPAWLREFGQRDENRAISFLRDMDKATKANPKLAKEPQMVALREYIAARDQMIGILKQTGAGLSAQQNEPLAALWDQYVQGLIQKSPGFEQIYARILDQDGLTLEVTDSGANPAPVG